MEFLSSGMKSLETVFRGEIPSKKAVVEVYKDTKNPTKSWDQLKVKQKVDKIKLLPADTPVYPDKLRFVCLSDTHNQTDRMTSSVPVGDVLLHAGDFTNVGGIKDVVKFNEFLGRQPHKHKVVIAGNHDLTFDEHFLHEASHELERFGLKAPVVLQELTSRNVEKTEELLTNCIYLRDSEVNICGVRIYGSPWQPAFCDWGFNLERGQPCLDKWDLIPEGVDVLITHGPPIGHGDFCSSATRAGCVELLHTIQNRVKPKYHIFGHIHEGYGVTTDRHTTYVNASTCTLRYKATNPPVLFDIPLPEGYTKEQPFGSDTGPVIIPGVSYHSKQPTETTGAASGTEI